MFLQDNQKAGSTFYFYAVTNHKIRNIESLKDDETEVSVVNFLDNDDIAEPLEAKSGIFLCQCRKCQRKFRK